MGTYYQKKEMFIREVVRKIELAYKHKQAVSIAIYPHSATTNHQPKVDKEIGEFGSCHHLNFHKAHHQPKCKKCKKHNQLLNGLCEFCHEEENNK